MPPPAILVIDDDKRMGELLRDTLAEENLGHTASVITTALGTWPMARWNVPAPIHSMALSKGVKLQPI